MGKKKEQREAQGAAAEWLLAQLSAGDARSKDLHDALLELPGLPAYHDEGLAWSYKSASSSASLCRTFLTSWVSEAWGAPKDLAETLRNKSSNPEFVRKVMGEVLQGSHDTELQQKYSALCTPAGIQNASNTEPNKRKRMQAFGQSFQCPECAEIFPCASTKWGILLEHIKQVHPGAAKPNRKACLVDVAADGTVAHSGEKHGGSRKHGRSLLPVGRVNGGPA